MTRSARRRREAHITVERLEGRQLLAVPAAFAPRMVPPHLPLAVAEHGPLPAVGVQPPHEPRGTLVRLRTAIYGTLLPGVVVPGGEEGFAYIVAGGVAWKLDLTKSRELDVYAGVIAFQPVVAFGTATIGPPTQPGGPLTRGFAVNWMERLQSPDPQVSPFPPGTPPIPIPRLLALRGPARGR